jgi:hypothetical protein
MFGLDRILLVPLFASILCQAVLLSLWGVTSRVSPWGRMAGLVAGAVYLEALWFSGDLRRGSFGVSTITIAITTAICLVGRALGLRLAQQDNHTRPARADAEGLRFSIRGLMVFTAAVALLSAGARALQESPRRMILLMSVWSMCFVAVGLADFWATLGNVRPLGRGTIVLVLSPSLGAFFAFAAGAHPHGWAYIILTMLLYAALLLGSLLVVRSCGYRLVRRAAPFCEPSDGGDGRSSLQTPVGGATTSV